MHPAEPFYGDARIGSDPDTLSLQLLNTALNSATYGVPTVGDFLRKDKGYDWGQMQALNLPDFNVFFDLMGRWFYYQYYDNPF